MGGIFATGKLFSFFKELTAHSRQVCFPPGRAGGSSCNAGQSNEIELYGRIEEQRFDDGHGGTRNDNDIEQLALIVARCGT